MNDTVSPFLMLPIRTETEARADIANGVSTAERLRALDDPARGKCGMSVAFDGDDRA